MKTEEDAALRRSSFFQFLPDDVFEKISSLLKEEHYEFGDIIVREGDPAEAFYVLTSGRARAIKIMPNGDEVALGALRPGDGFGEAALAEGGTVRMPLGKTFFAPRFGMLLDRFGVSWMVIVMQS